MHKKIGEDRMCNSGDMLAVRQTDKQTDIHGHHNTQLPYRGGVKQLTDEFVTNVLSGESTEGLMLSISSIHLLFIL